MLACGNYSAAVWLIVKLCVVHVSANDCFAKPFKYLNRLHSFLIFAVLIIQHAKVLLDFFCFFIGKIKVK